MSRNINITATKIEAGELHNQIQSKDAKIIITNWQGLKVIFLYHHNRILYAYVLHDMLQAFDCGGIIIGRIKDISHELKACFVEISKDQIAYLRMNQIPESYFPLTQGQLLPVCKLADAQKGKRVALTAKINWNKLPNGMQVKEQSIYKSAFSCIYDGENEIDSQIQLIFNIAKKNENIHITEIVTNLTDVFEKQKSSKYFEMLRLYADDAFSLEKLYSINKLMEEATSRKIWLSNGGYLIMDTTEALTVFDVNSGKYDKGSRKKKALDQGTEIWNQMVQEVNQAALEEIAIQLQLRNISGMILIDLLNMESDEERNDMIEYMRNLVKKDICNVKVLDITELGIMEITRQKRYPSLFSQITIR